MTGLGTSAIQQRIEQQCKQLPRYRHKPTGRVLEVVMDLGGACELQDNTGSTYASREALKNTDAWERLP